MPKREDRKLTTKENYLRVLNGEMPEWVPIYTMGAPLPDGDPYPIAMVTPTVLHDPHGMGVASAGDENGIPDIWGVTWVGNYETGGALMPTPGRYILDDIDNWHDVIKAPDISDVDWEQMCKETLEPLHLDREQQCVGLNLCAAGLPFQNFVGMMGWTEGLIALFEEPEECFELFDYMTDFYVEVGKNCMPYLEPDVLILIDDTCNAKAPFISEDLFKQCMLPCYKKLYEALAEPYGIPVQFHNCGTAAHYIELCHEEAGVSAWDPAQTVNDLPAFKEKWGREIAILGGYDPNGRLLEPDCPDELLIQSVRDVYDQLAPDGGFAFLGMFVGPRDDMSIAHKNEVIMRAAQEYGDTFYDK